MMLELIAISATPAVAWWATHLGPERLMAALCAVWHPDRSRRRDAGGVLARLLPKDPAEETEPARRCDCDPGAPDACPAECHQEHDSPEDQN